MNALKDYQNFVESTKAGNLSFEENMMLAGLGLTGEAGEIADLIKKKLFHKHEIDRDEFVKEIGDVLWYIVFLCNSLGIELEEAINVNISKLKRRYPKGFSSEASIARVDQLNDGNDYMENLMKLKLILDKCDPYVFSTIDGKGCHIGKITEVGLDANDGIIIKTDICSKSSTI